MPKTLTTNREREREREYFPRLIKPVFLLFFLLFTFGITTHASAATNVYYSVGQNTTDHKTGSPTVTVSGTTATFSVAQTATNMGVGDLVTYTSGSCYISGKTSTTVWSCVSATGGTPTAATGETVTSIAHAYASLSAAIAGASDASHINNTDLTLATGADVILNIPCYYDTGADTTAVTVTGYTTGASNYIRIYTATSTTSEVNQSQRHSGVWSDTKYRLEASAEYSQVIMIGSGYVRIDGLQISNSGNKGSSSRGIRESLAGTSNDVYISNNIIRATGIGISASPSDGITFNEANVKIWNNILYDWYIGVSFDWQNTYVIDEILYNNTVVDNVNYGIYVGGGVSGNIRIYNNISYHNSVDLPTSTDYYYTNIDASGNNISSDASSPDGAGYQNKTLTFLDSVSNNFHLTNSDSAARDAGTDLSADAYLSFSTDIDGGTRSGTWDIGADEYVDSTQPTRSNGSPSGTLSYGTTETTISLDTDENATCKYSTSSGTSYASMTDTFSTTGTTSHSTTVSGLSNGNTYHYYVRCQDGSGNPNTDDYDISFSVEAVDATPPTITSVSSNTANGTYYVGDIIDIDVVFSEAVTSTGNVTITLETGATDRTCTFSVTNSSTGTCNYTVQTGDISSDLNVSSISGVIADQAALPMTNFVPTTNLSANKALVIQALPAFPGAEGQGSSTLGGRGGTVCIVDTLSDNGADGQTFRECVEALGPRIVVFEVSGVIWLDSRLNIENDYLTIAGQTSPGGISIAGFMVTFDGVHDVIVQHMRFRPGPLYETASGTGYAAVSIVGGSALGSADGKDSAGTDPSYNIIFDHGSFSWANDTNLNIGYDAYDITFSWSSFIEPLHDAGHDDGANHNLNALNWGRHNSTPYGVTYHHSYFGDSLYRVPETNFYGFVDLTNNVVYDAASTWAPVLEPVDDGGILKKCYMNIRNSYQDVRNSNSASTAHNAVMKTNSITPYEAIYMSGSIQSSLGGNTPGWNVGDYGNDWGAGLLSTDWQANSQFAVRDIPVTATAMDSAYAAYIVANAGANRVRSTSNLTFDSVDLGAQTNFTNNTGNWKEASTLDAENDWPVFLNPSSPTDSDNDGMSDSWETARGLNTGSNDSSGDDDSDEYTNIEEYLFELGGYQNSADSTPPTLTQVTAVSTPTTDTTPSYTFNTTEAGTITYGGDCTSATTSATSGDNTITFSTLTAGTHSNCTITVTDAASNPSSALSVNSFTIDTTGPTGTISNGNGTPTNDTTPTLNLTIADTGVGTSGASMRFSCDNTTWSTWESYTTPKTDFNIKTGAGCTDADGSKTVYVEYRDSLNNTGSAYNTGAFTLDTVSANASLSNTPASITTATGASITVAGTDVTAYKYKLDSGSYGDETVIATAITLSGLSDSSHTIYVIGKDSAGNWQAEGEATTYSWTVDTTSPSVTFTIPSTSSSLTITFTSFSATDTNTITGYLVNESATTPDIDDANWSGTAQTTYTFLAEGTKTLYAWAKDVANNISTGSTGSVVITIPSASVSHSSGGGGYTRPLIPTKTPEVLEITIPQGCSGGNKYNTSTGALCQNTVVNTVKTTYNLGTTTLKNGSKGESVKELQRFLNEKLNSKLIIDGKLGPKTVVVIKQYQKANGLVADGLVGKKTRGRMKLQ